nr:acyltransferase [Oceanococcus sp. HetDA_MAG_MS8]
MAQQRIQNISELDGLRGVGALMVVFYHWDPTYIFWAWCWVPMFFVLSGYLIGRIILIDLVAGRFSLRNFYIRRALRVWPAYYFVLVVYLVYSLSRYGDEFFATVRFTEWKLSMVYLQFTPLYFNLSDHPFSFLEFLPGLLPIWTLAIEEQFYLCLPLLLLLIVPRFGLIGISVALVGLLVVGLYLKTQVLAPVLLLSQIDCLALGVGLAVAVHYAAGSTGSTRNLMKVACLGWISMLSALGSLLPYLIAGYSGRLSDLELLHRPLLWTQAAVLFMGLIALIVTSPPRWWLGWLRSKVPVYLGSLSYAIYLFHMPFLTFVEPRVNQLIGEQKGWPSFAIVLALILIAAHLSGVLIEGPAMRLKRLFPTSVSKRATDDSDRRKE